MIWRLSISKWDLYTALINNSHKSPQPQNRNVSSSRLNCPSSTSGWWCGVGRPFHYLGPATLNEMSPRCERLPMNQLSTGLNCGNWSLLTHQMLCPRAGHIAALVTEQDPILLTASSTQNPFHSRISRKTALIIARLLCTRFCLHFFTHWVTTQLYTTSSTIYF